MPSVPEHAVPTGPLAVRWLSYELPVLEAGALQPVRVELENAGAAAWSGLKLSYHWLDELGNAIAWDGVRAELPPLAPGESIAAEAHVRAPIPPGRYRLAFDVVLELRYWLSEIGNEVLALDVGVGPRDASSATAHVDGLELGSGWHELVRAAHEEGYAAVGGAVERLSGYEPGGGRKPGFTRPLACPSLLPPLAPNCEVEGLPAWKPEGDEPWLYDAAITARLRSGRRRG